MNEKLKVLMELRPGFEGFAGIPQETRLVFLSLLGLDNIEVTGLINHGQRNLWSGVRRGLIARQRYKQPYARVHDLARFAISVKVDPVRTAWEAVYRYLENRMEVRWYSLRAQLGLSHRIDSFEAEDFGGFIWDTLFSKSLPAQEFEFIRRASYATMQQSWALMGRVALHRGLRRPLMSLDTRGYDVFLSQTPWPGELHRSTQLVVRYHDAIPIFMPHTISNARIHQYAHMAALYRNHFRGIFACTSEAVRGDLLKMYPELEHRSVVVNDIVSHEYYLDQCSADYRSNIIRSNICSTTEPKFLNPREKQNFYERNLQNRNFPYILMVSSLEPRKNHLKMIGAWDYLKNNGMPDLKLIVVGELGWDYDNILESMAPWQLRGELFHLHRVPSPQLRLLYNGATAVVCPSLNEGFDLSGIEAMLCGGAVVASDIPVHREIYGEACGYFNPYSTLEMARAIRQVIAPEAAGRRQQLVDIGLAHAPKYRRESLAPQWREVFDRLRAGDFTPRE